MGKVVYMFSGQDRDFSDGPLLGAPGISFPALLAEYRAMRYAKAEAAGEDFCLISEGDFIAWLIEREILSPMGAVNVVIDTSGESEYVPSHWPLCPECDVGRGEPDTGRILHALNRREWHRKCTECRHIWDRNDEPYLFDKPMLDDDGRCIAGGCVPYSISQAGGIPMQKVLDVCRGRGWSEGDGMPEEQGIEAAQVLGLRMVSGSVRMIAGKLTLRKLLDTLSPAKNYIVATRGHWLAVIEGENRDQADTHSRTEVTGYWEVQVANIGVAK